MSVLKELQYLKEELEEKQQRYDDLQNHDCEEEYDDMLNECYPEVFNILPSRILSECDPIAYNCGYNDWADNELSELESEIEELKEEIKEVSKLVIINLSINCN